MLITFLRERVTPRVEELEQNKEKIGTVQHGKLWLECEITVNLIVVKKGERYDETGKIRDILTAAMTDMDCWHQTYGLIRDFTVEKLS